MVKKFTHRSTQNCGLIKHFCDIVGGFGMWSICWQIIIFGQKEQFLRWWWWGGGEQSFQLSRNGRDSPGILVYQSVPPGTTTCLFNVLARRQSGRQLCKLWSLVIFKLTLHCIHGCHIAS